MLDTFVLIFTREPVNPIDFIEFFEFSTREVYREEEGSTREVKRARQLLLTFP